MLMAFCGFAKAVDKEAYAVYNDGTLTFYYDNARSSKPGTTYDLNTGSNTPGWYDEHYKDITYVNFTSSFSDARPTSTYAWFAYSIDTQIRYPSHIISIAGLDYLNTSEVTDMGYMFYCCANLTFLKVSGFDTHNVTNMGGMFTYCDNLTSLDVSGFNTAKVTDMSDMFSECYKLENLDVSGFDTQNVTDMEGMFHNCKSLTSLDVSGFDTSNVTNMKSMFSFCSLTSIDVSGFNTEKVTDMAYMFYNCRNLTSLDLSGFDTHNVKIMYGMFMYCINLTTIYAGDGWNTDKVHTSNEMFNYCNNLVGGKETTFDSNNMDKYYAHIDGGTSSPGYFTMKIFQLYVGGTRVTSMNKSSIPVTSGTASYSPVTKTLTLNNAKITATDFDNCIMNDDPTIYGGGIDGLTINVIGYCQLDAEYCAVSLNQNTTIGGIGSLYVNSSSDEGIYISGGNSLTCKVKRMNVTAAKDAIKGIYSANTFLNIDGSTLICMTNNPDNYSPIIGFRTLGQTMKNCRFGDPGGAWKYNDTSKFSCKINGDIGCILFNGLDYRGKVVIEPASEPVKYRLWVGGTQVTSANKDNIEGLENGTTTFNPDTHTLTLNNSELDYAGYGDAISNGTSSDEGMPDFTILCEGESTLAAVEEACIMLYGNTTITGSRLNVYSPDHDITYGIKVGEGVTLTLQNADVYTEAKFPVFCDYANTNSIVNVVHSCLQAVSSSNNPPVRNLKEFNLSDCNYVATQAALNPTLFSYNTTQRRMEYNGSIYNKTLLIEPTQIGISTGTGEALPQDKVQSDEWYTIDGQKLSGKPAKKGIYIHNGHKRVVK